MKPIRVAWAITGAGEYLAESLEVVRTIKDELGVSVTALASRNAEIVMKWYKLWDQVNSAIGKVMVERGPNEPFLAGPLQVGRYVLLFVSPATANTTAKIAHGIADSLVSNCVAQAIKGGTPVYICPVDQRLGTITTRIPSGKRIRIRTRSIDVENVDRIRGMEGITVLRHPREMEAIVRSIQAGDARSMGQASID